MGQKRHKKQSFDPPAYEKASTDFAGRAGVWRRCKEIDTLETPTEQSNAWWEYKRKIERLSSKEQEEIFSIIGQYQFSKRTAHLKDWPIARIRYALATIGGIILPRDRDEVRKGVKKGERLFNDTCDEFPSMPYAGIERYLHRSYGISKINLAQYKKRRKKRQGEYREEPRVTLQEKRAMLLFLKKLRSAPALEDLPKLFDLPKERIEEIVKGLHEQRKIRIVRKNFGDRGVKEAVLVGPFDS